MGKKPAISAEKRAQIVGRSILKLSKRGISRRMKVSKTAVHNVIKKFQNKGTFKNSKKSGRPRISSIRDDRVIAKMPKWPKSIDNLRLIVFSRFDTSFCHSTLYFFSRACGRLAYYFPDTHDHPVYWKFLDDLIFCYLCFEIF